MGTYAQDRQAKLQRLLFEPATRLPDKRFLVAGPQYPETILWPRNVEHIIHLEPKFHPPFYCSSRMTLNLTRREMVQSEYSPSVRLFEAAGCGAAIISDNWPGLETFFVPQREILLAETAAEVLRYLEDIKPHDARTIGRAARERVMAEHTAEKRALEFEEYVGAKALAKEWA